MTFFPFLNFLNLFIWSKSFVHRSFFLNDTIVHLICSQKFSSFTKPMPMICLKFNEWFQIVSSWRSHYNLGVEVQLTCFILFPFISSTTQGGGQGGTPPFGKWKKRGKRWLPLFRKWKSGGRGKTPLFGKWKRLTQFCVHPCSFTRIAGYCSLVSELLTQTRIQEKIKAWKVLCFLTWKT